MKHHSASRFAAALNSAIDAGRLNHQDPDGKTPYDGASAELSDNELVNAARQLDDDARARMLKALQTLQGAQTPPAA